MTSLLPRTPDYELLAYQQAALAVMARLHFIPVHFLSLEAADPSIRPKASIERFLTWLRSQCRTGQAAEICAECYVETLLAWGIGGLFCLEERCRGSRTRNAIARLSIRLLGSVKSGDIREYDLAFSIVFGWLHMADDGNSEVTLERLWRRVRETLREESNVDLIGRIARELQLRRRLETVDLDRLDA